MTENKTSSRQRFVIPILAIAALLLMVAWMAGLFSQKVAPGLNQVAMPSPNDLLEVQYQAVTVLEAAPASVEAKFSTLISSRILARITQIHVRAGDYVEKGQLLVELEKSDLLAKSRQAAEQINAVSARLAEAEKNLTRVRQLRQQGIMPVAELDRAKANTEALRAELAAAKQTLEEAQAAVAYTEIRSPIDGRIVDRFAEQGATAYPGNKLLSLYNPNSLRVEVQVREQLALSIEIGQTVAVEIPSLGKRLNAIVEERVPAAEPGSRSFLLKARIEQDPALLPGMYARVLIPTGTEQRLLLPSDRVVQVGQLNLIWVWQDGQAYRRFVRTGKTDSNGMTHILSGLEPGDQVAMPEGNTI